MFFEFLIITDNSEHIIDQNNCGYHFGHNCAALLSTTSHF